MEWCHRNHGRRSKHTQEQLLWTLIKLEEDHFYRLSFGFFLSDSMMRKLASAISLVLVCALLAECAPQDSLFPLFSNTDNAFECRLLGKWTVQGGTEQTKPGEKSGIALFEKSRDGISYILTIP